MADVSKIKINNVDYQIKDAQARADIASLIGSTNVSEAIDSFNEVVAFLNGVTNDETLTGKLSDINDRIDGIEAVTGTVDDALSTTSEFPVQNKVVTVALNGKYVKPSGGIPSSDLATAVQTSLGKADTAYQKPSGGIPSSDLATAVQTSLGKADTALQADDISDMAKKSELQINTGATSDKKVIQLKSGTSQEVLIAHQDISGKADKSTAVTGVSYDSTTKKIQKTINGSTTDVVTLATVATSGSYNDLSNKPSIPTVPTNVSSFTNDATYQTQAQVTSALADCFDGYDSLTETLEFTFPTAV